MTSRSAPLLLLLSLLLEGACAVSDEVDQRSEDPAGFGGSTSSGGTSGSGATGSGATGSGATGSGATGSGATGGAGGGPPACDEALRRCPREITYPDSGETSVEVRGDFSPDGWVVGVPMTRSGAEWSATIELPWNVEVQYKLVIDGSQWITDPANPDTVPDGVGGENSWLAASTCEDWSCAPAVGGTFDWRDAVLYFVFVDRFWNGDASNDGPAIAGVPTETSYQGGDWAGVREKLEAGWFDALGVNVLWLSVPMDNPDRAGLGDDGQLYSGYHGYWPSDLDATESRFGSLQELIDLVDAAHARGIRVIVDYAMNHVHETAPVYAQHPDWFWPLDYQGKSCVCGAGCSWEGAEGKRCWFRDYLPDFDFTRQAARDFSVDNAVGWIEKTGIDGFRLDAVKHVEDAWLSELRARVSADIEPASGEHFYMVGETFTGDRDLIKAYVDPATKLDGQFDFPLRANVVASLLVRSQGLDALDGFLASNDGYYGAGVMSTFVGNHDVPRSIHFAEDQPLWSSEWADGKDRAWQNRPSAPSNASAYERLANAFTLIFTLRGVPLVYYGDEIGMPGAGDPDNRRAMQWSGLSAAQTALLEHVKQLGAIRAEHAALRRGTRTTLAATADTLAYSMKHGGDELIVAINRSDASRDVSGLPGSAFDDLLDGSVVSGPSLTLPARSARILKAKP